jgi:hypothetical protein
MTWEELERLPEEIAEQIELWNGRVVWTGYEPCEHRTFRPGEHQIFTRRLTNSLERCARTDISDHSEHRWVANLATSVFFGGTEKSDFMTPDFVVYRCLGTPYQDVRAGDVVLAGVVLSPGNRVRDMETIRARYADGGIPWYWEVELARDDSAIDVMRAYALQTHPGQLPDGVRALHQANYLVVGEWNHADENGIEFDHPFPISIPWSDLEF